jgi:hypothetical protein
MSRKSRGLDELQRSVASSQQETDLDASQTGEAFRTQLPWTCLMIVPPTAPTIVTSRPSRIDTVPSPITNAAIYLDARRDRAVERAQSDSSTSVDEHVD